MRNVHRVTRSVGDDPRLYSGGGGGSGGGGLDPSHAGRPSAGMVTMAGAGGGGGGGSAGVGAAGLPKGVSVNHRELFSPSLAVDFAEDSPFFRRKVETLGSNVEGETTQMAGSLGPKLSRSCLFYVPRVGG